MFFKTGVPGILAALSIAAASVANAADATSPSQLSNDQIKQEIISRSIASYSGPCPCPYNTMRNGRHCGGNSAYSRPGGRSPICYPSDVTDKMVVAQPEMTVRAAANLMRGHAVHCLPVFDRHHHLKGIVTVVDVLELIGRGAERPGNAVAGPVLRNRGVVPHQATVRDHARRAAR